tara:strand:- start:114 stop:716 length:603 start_codon:yes stop_codon:yes gene_type:complete
VNKFNRGFTLVELIIATVLMLVAFGSLFSIFVGGVKHFTRLSDNSSSDYGIHRMFSQLNIDLIQHGEYDYDNDSVQIDPDGQSVVLSRPLEVNSESGEVEYEEIKYYFDQENGYLFRNGVCFRSIEFEDVKFSIYTKKVIGVGVTRQIKKLRVSYKLKSQTNSSISNGLNTTSFQFNLWHENERIAFNSWNSALSDFDQF